jgi:hypothetical protein
MKRDWKAYARLLWRGLLCFFIFCEIAALKQGSDQFFERESGNYFISDGSLGVCIDLIQAMGNCLKRRDDWASHLGVFSCDVFHG